VGRPKISEAEINRRLQEAGNTEFIVVYDTFKQWHVKCLWLHVPTGQTVERHPAHMTRKKASPFAGGRAGKTFYKEQLSEEEINARAQIHNPNLKVVYSTYKGARYLCEWLDGNKKLVVRPSSVFAGIKTHVQSTTEAGARKHNMTVEEYCTWQEGKRKKARLAKYGVENIMLLPEHQAKCHARIDRQKWAKTMKEKAEALGVRNMGWTDKAFKTRKQNGTLYSSKAERDVLAWVQTICPDAVGQHHLDGRCADIYVPSKNLVIEYNGLHWHSTGKRANTNYHLEILNRHQAQGRGVINIWEHEWLQRQDKVKHYLAARLGKFEQRTTARKLTLAEVPKRIAQSLLKDWHLQGPPAGATVYMGLQTETGEVLALVAGGKHHRNVSVNVLSRFACKPGVQVVGALARLSKALRQRLGTSLVTWADLRLTEGKAYEQAGWGHAEDLPPDYFYFKKGTLEVVSKQSRKKSNVGTPEGMTEFEHAERDGLHRVYDCGKRRFVLP
jgi:hypothetical protein